MDSVQTLAHRLGLTVHVSPLRFKLARLQQDYPCPDAAGLEEWLVEVANQRGADVISRPEPHARLLRGPDESELSNEALVVAICHLQNRDLPQMLRLAAQLISRQAVDTGRLIPLAIQDRVEPVLGALAVQALRVAPAHPAWQELAARFGGQAPLQQPVLHWTRLAEPVMQPGKCNAQGWKLVA